MEVAKAKKVIFLYPGGTSTSRIYHWFPFPYLYMTSILRNHGFEVVIIDARVSEDWRKLLTKELDSACFLGITVMTGEPIAGAIEASKIAKSYNPKIPVVWGGYHPSLLPEMTLAEDYVDIVVIREGENIIVDLATALSNGDDLKKVNSIVFKEDGKIIYTPTARQPLLSEFPSVSYDLLDIEAYRSENNIASILSTRACPFRCSFCNTAMRKVHFRTIDQTIEEIEILVKRYKFTNIFFQDSLFFISKKRVMELTRRIIESGLNILWKAKARANSFKGYSLEEIKLLQKSGLRSLFIGLESGSPRILDLMLKDTTPTDAEETAAICKDFNFEFYASFMYAVYRDSVESLKETIEHIHTLKQINKDMVFQNCIYQPLPGSLMYQQVIEDGYIPPDRTEGWIDKNVTMNFENRDDITWIKSDELERYKKIWYGEFSSFEPLKHRERTGEYTPPFRKSNLKQNVVREERR
jgi:radical SAM superfamily enzyme YgiQ (UPF0313 family)